jgi:hypothetical protein
LFRRQRRGAGPCHIDNNLRIWVAPEKAMRHMHRQRRLAEPAHAFDRADRNTAGRSVQCGQQLVRLTLAASKVSNVCGELMQ